MELILTELYQNELHFTVDAIDCGLGIYSV